ncbi:guanosine polyphosphate pyrophosphohydrolase [Comamonas serinivorans]|uniref:Guanosine polyphosphate pyrophosphohydrolase n=1 Tax=Comamonas serinivorans TaxID=1082851 RepID=A0A1Y0EM21_9BURK|nr:HD domain-containing protein [Comamonas serinivorans]ARU04695.1 guanosine polyphosphate pyrophosphohydrolase [Comamonas serinivorans]
MALAYDAMVFAREAHKDQRRKYTGNPYSDHLAEVAGIVAAAELPNPDQSLIEQMVAVSWLHDTAEDTAVTLEEIERRFGFMVAVGVSGLTDIETGNRAERKAKSRDRLTRCAGWIQTIKVADLISNTSSIVENDPKFAVVYLEEARLLLDVLTRADPRLVEIARSQCR